MKKLTVLASSLVLVGASASVIAADPGFYVGGQVGYQNNDVEVNQDSSFNSSKADNSLSGVAGGLFAGVKFDLGNNFFVAPEINVGTSNADGKVRTDLGRVKAEAKESYGVGVLGGFEITRNTDIYARAGYQRTKYEVKQNLAGVGSSSDDDRFKGFRYGVGMETALAPQMALRLDWSQTNYSDESYSSGDSRVKFDPTENLFQVGVAYTF